MIGCRVWYCINKKRPFSLRHCYQKFPPSGLSGLVTFEWEILGFSPFADLQPGSGRPLNLSPVINNGSFPKSAFRGLIRGAAVFAVFLVLAALPVGVLVVVDLGAGFILADGVGCLIDDGLIGGLIDCFVTSGFEWGVADGFGLLVVVRSSLNFATLRSLGSGETGDITLASPTIKSVKFRVLIWTGLAPPMSRWRKLLNGARGPFNFAHIDSCLESRSRKNFRPQNEQGPRPSSDSDSSSMFVCLFSFGTFGHRDWTCSAISGAGIWRNRCIETKLSDMNLIL